MRISHNTTVTMNKSAECDGKQAHETAAVAQKLAKRVKGTRVYRCRFCGKYHLGRNK